MRTVSHSTCQEKNVYFSLNGENNQHRHSHTSVSNVRKGSYQRIGCSSWSQGLNKYNAVTMENIILVLLIESVAFVKLPSNDSPLLSVMALNSHATVKTMLSKKRNMLLILSTLFQTWNGVVSDPLATIFLEWNNLLTKLPLTSFWSRPDWIYCRRVTESLPPDDAFQLQAERVDSGLEWQVVAATLFLVLVFWRSLASFGK